MTCTGMTRIIVLIAALLLCFTTSAAAGFSFSEYEERQEEKSLSSGTEHVDLSTINCSGKLKSQRIALIIAEKRNPSGWLLQQREYRPFYEAINKRLHELGLRTYSPEEIDRRIAEEEIRAMMNGDTAAALSASKRLGASHFLRGLITSRSRLNRVVGIQEVFVSLDFSLTDAGGRLISQKRVDSAAFSGADTTSSALELVRANADQVVAGLYRDFCKWLKEHPQTQQQAAQKRPPLQQTVSPAAEISSSIPENRKKVETVIVSAEGLADPSSETYKGDRGLMIDALRRDARRQAIEKAVGTFVDSSTLVENFTVVSDRVLTRSSGLIKRIIKQTSPWEGKDGLMHMLIKAEIFISDVKEALDSLSQEQRLQLIKEKGDPTISVAVRVRDAARDSGVPVEQSTIAENILKEKFKGFGFRVWSEEYSRMLKGEYAGNRRQADFSVIGEAKFARKSVPLPGSGVRLTRHTLTSWSVKCVNNHTGEEIYFNNQIPAQKNWDNEDKALRDIGYLIGDEFNRDFFSTYLNRPSTIFQMEITGLPDYDTALLIKKDLIGLRPVLNAEIRNFSSDGLSIFEVDFAGSQGNFSHILNNTVLRPINAKLGDAELQLTDRHGNVVRITFQSELEPAEIRDRLESMPPASLAQAAPERVTSLIHDEAVLNKVKKINPYLRRDSKDRSSVPGAASIMQSF